MGTGQGPGLSGRSLGESAGVEAITLLTAQMPIHNHVVSLGLNVKNAAGNSRTAGGNVLANEAAGVTAMYSTASPDATLSGNALSATVGTAGGSQPASIMQPYLALNYIIALYGIYPSRN